MTINFEHFQKSQGFEQFRIQSNIYLKQFWKFRMNLAGHFILYQDVPFLKQRIHHLLSISLLSLYKKYLVHAAKTINCCSNHTP